MNSQRKQKAKVGIKTDKYGVPVNYGNYKNGRLVKPKSSSSGGRGRGHTGRGGRGNSNGRGGGAGGRTNGNNMTGRGRGSNTAAPAAGAGNRPRGATEKLASVGLSAAAHDVIHGALQQLSSSAAVVVPSNDDGAQEASGRKKNVPMPSSDDHATKTRKQGRSHNCPDLQPPSMISQDKKTSDPMGPMGEQRRGLPVYGYKEKLLSTIANHRVTVVEGETGSGKTTQVPQFCLEDAAARGVPCNIIVAQPRRISAMSVAERVAAERGETIGGTVGYTIRLESKATSNTRLLFCTTGILLKRLEEDAALQHVTHVFVDEVHERSIESDFLLMVLRDVLGKRPTDRPLKVVLMSATLDASLFHDYFDGAPSVQFPGRTFPVTELYLEDAVEVTGHKVKGNEDWCRKGGKASSSEKRGGPNQKPGDWTCGHCQANNFARNSSCFKCQKVAPKGNDATTKLAPKGTHLQDKDDTLLEKHELESRYAKYSPNTQAVLSKLDHDAIDYALVVETIQWLSNLRSPREAASYLNGKRPSKKENNGRAKDDTTDLAILVFLPGMKEITTLQELLIKSSTFCKSPARDWVLPIHSTIPPEEQRLVFTRPPAGVRKVVLATNIAETAITIDDVAFVVDTGRMKENRYDPLKRMSSLEDCLVARSNARQRRGRAGRVREGVAVHLFTKHRHDKIAAVAQAPEVQRVPLEQLVLRIKALKYPGTSAEVCAQLVEPPAPQAVQRAVDELTFLEAMMIENGREELTALGVHLSTLPVDCRIGKLILLGAMFGVTDDALTIAATLSYRSPFQAPMMKREEADRAKMTFATAQSDHLTVLNAYKQVDAMGNARYDFCRENFLSIKTMQTIAGLKRQFLELLSAAGFVRPDLRSRGVEALGRRNGGTDGVALALKQGLYRSSGSGDWICSRCKGNNFGRNRKCFKCKSPKTTLGEESRKAESEPQASAPDEVESGQKGDSTPNDGSDPKTSLLKALLVAALFPQMVVVEESKGKQASGGPVLKAGAENGQKQEDMALHPSCIAGKTLLSSKYLVYHERVKTTRVYIRDATPVGPYALILFGGGQMKVESGGVSGSVLRLDGWLGFKCPRRDHLLIMELRELLDSILRHKVENPKRDFTEDAEGVIEAVKAILEMDEDGKAMAPERIRVEDAFKRLKENRRSNSNKSGRDRGRGGRSRR